MDNCAEFEKASSTSAIAMRWRIIGFTLCRLLLAVFVVTADGANPAPPQPLREFRGAWIATVANIDWPSRPGLSSSEQKAELLAIVEKAAQLKLNALLFQVRPACDALYASKIEPWSEYLTGKMGQAPDPCYDPLALLIEQAHQRGLEVHAWFNPFRARYSSPLSVAVSNHISRTHPKVVRNYGKLLWLDPSELFVQQRSQAVILDVVRRYDIDGVHMDDYFYPYPKKDAAGKRLDFPDQSNWQKYLANGGKLSRGDWRRKHVDDFVQNLYRSIRAEKSWVKVGISPFGIWRPGEPKQITGLDAYDELYADARKWLAQGWLDYVAPQLYWAIDPPAQSYPVLLKWWTDQNLHKRHVWPGNNSFNAGGKWRAQEIVNQVRLTRRQLGATGNIHWNMTSLLRNRGGLADTLARDIYAQPSLVPASSWLDKQPPSPPQLAVERDQSSKPVKVSWRAANSETIWLWIFQTRTDGKWTTEILPGKEMARSLAMRARNSGLDWIAVTAVDRCSNAGQATLLNVSNGQIAIR
ncbi:MAG: hypothetical protein FJ403_19215 [Verrucomicrobia bacterium]|nr:hypothetical protein [Verrucomicrobiota bacterium]